MNKDSVIEFAGREAGIDPLTDLLRSGAKQLIHQAVEAELQELLSAHADRVTDDGKAGVVRNGYLPEREIQTGVGPVKVKIPKVRAKTGEPVTFRSALEIFGVRVKTPLHLNFEIFGVRVKTPLHLNF